MFDFIKDAFNSTIGKVVNEAFSPIGDILKSTGLAGILEPVCGMLGKIPGIDSTVGGVFGVLPDLIEGKFDLNDALKLGSIFAPPPANMICSMGDLDKVLGQVGDITGGIDPNSQGGQNLLSFAQNLAWNLPS
ncbi:MAG: hypothetical protein U1E65_00250 [Myxococcota bacterium]